MRVALFVQDDSAVRCLEVLAARGCEVLGLNAGGSGCASFARCCVELGFGLSSLKDASVAAAAAESFKPELLVLLRTAGSDEALPQLFSAASAQVAAGATGGPRRYVLGAAAAAPWPEAAPIWRGQAHSRVFLTAAGATEAVGSIDVAVDARDTALSLRAKHGLAAAELLDALAAGGKLPAAGEPAEEFVASNGRIVPASINLSWDEATVDRFVRAWLLPPNDPAIVADPASNDTYFIENMEQYRELCSRVLNDSMESCPSNKAYAADTHWYSNVGGTIVKMGDSDIHMPTRVADKKRKTLIPGAAKADSSRKKLRMNEPLIGPNAERYCSSALASSWIGVEGPYVKRFERELARICGCSAACAVQSGTAALYGAMKALGVSDASHHVLVPSFTCAACADAVVHAGGLPVPIDCDLETYGLSAEAVRRSLEADKDVVGVVVAPCYGVPSRDFKDIHALCKARGLWICEDACESYGAATRIPDGQGGEARMPVGSVATLCVISVRSEKMIGVGEGGAILGNDATLVARAKWWCSRAPCRGVGLWRVYEHDAVGQNFRLPEMLAAVGCAAAEMLPLMVERKCAIHAWYEAGFAAHEPLRGIRLQKCSPRDEPVWWITAALLPDGVSGEQVGMRLMKDYPDIEIRPGFFPLNMMAIFKSDWLQPCPNAERLYNGMVCLPSSHQLTKPDVERVCRALADALTCVTTGEVE